MSGRLFAIKPKAAVNCAASPTVTYPLYYQAPASNLAARLREFSISFDGISSSAPKARVDLARCSALGTWTTMTQAIEFDPDGPTIRGTFGHTATGAPTINALDADEDDIPFSEYVHLQGGYTWRLGDMGLIIPINGIIAVRVTPGSTAANCLPRFVIEE